MFPPSHCLLWKWLRWDRRRPGLFWEAGGIRRPGRAEPGDVFEEERLFGGGCYCCSFPFSSHPVPFFLFLFPIDFGARFFPERCRSGGCSRVTSPFLVFISACHFFLRSAWIFSGGTTPFVVFFSTWHYGCSVVHYPLCLGLARHPWCVRTGGRKPLGPALYCGAAIPNKSASSQ